MADSKRFISVFNFCDKNCNHTVNITRCFSKVIEAQSKSKSSLRHAKINRSIRTLLFINENTDVLMILFSQVVLEIDVGCIAIWYLFFVVLMVF